MSELDDLLIRAVADEDAPFVVAMVGDSDGVVWQGAAGQSSPGVVAGPDTLFRLWSMTKAIGTLAVLMLVDRGELSLDTPVGDVLPGFDELQVVEDVQGEAITARQPRTRATLGHLLTNTSGLAYPLYNAKMIKYMQATGMSYVLKGDIEELNYPLMFDPGSGWTYGIGLDWAGYMVQQVSGSPIDEFCRDEVFVPLGLSTLTFEREGVDEPLATAFVRSDGGFAENEFAPPPHPELYGLGNALYGTAPDYLAFLRFVLRGGELGGVRLIGQQTFDLMTSNQIGELSIPVLSTQDPSISADVELHFSETRMTHSAGFLRTEQDVPGMRSAGSLWWAGFLNTHYWVDPTRDVAAVFMTQTLPFCDRAFMGTFTEFERAAYRMLAT